MAVQQFNLMYKSTNTWAIMEKHLENMSSPHMIKIFAWFSAWFANLMCHREDFVRRWKKTKKLINEKNQPVISR
jgi:hypothetical protein